MDLSGSELIIILLVVVVLFGSARLPKLARSLGEAQREFRRGLLHHDEQPPAQATQPAQATPAAANGDASAAVTPSVQPSAPAVDGGPPPEQPGGPGSETTLP